MKKKQKKRKNLILIFFIILIVIANYILFEKNKTSKKDAIPAQTLEVNHFDEAGR